MLKLKPNPTFTVPVVIPTPGGDKVTIKMEFKHKSKDDYRAFVEDEKNKDRSDEDAILDIAANWQDVDGEFNRDNLRELCQQYHGAATAIVQTYIRELTQARLGN
jgi:hypothetical protein